MFKFNNFLSEQYLEEASRLDDISFDGLEMTRNNAKTLNSILKIIQSKSVTEGNKKIMADITVNMGRYWMDKRKAIVSPEIFNYMDTIFFIHQFGQKKLNNFQTFKEQANLIRTNVTKLRDKTGDLYFIASKMENILQTALKKQSIAEPQLQTKYFIDTFSRKDGLFWLILPTKDFLKYILVQYDKTIVSNIYLSDIANKTATKLYDLINRQEAHILAKKLSVAIDSSLKSSYIQ